MGSSTKDTGSKSHGASPLSSSLGRRASSVLKLRAIWAFFVIAMLVMYMLLRKNISTSATEFISDEQVGPYQFFWIFNSVDAPPCRLFHSVRSVLLYHPDASLKIYSFVEIGWAAEFPSLQVLPLDVVSVLAETPLEGWYDKRDEWKLEAMGLFPQHVSEALRLAFLFKSGGIFLENDMLLCKPVTASLRNALIARGRSDEVGASFLYFSRGSQLIRDAMELFSKEYAPRLITRNAPRVLASICKERNAQGLRCNILPSFVMYPIGVEALADAGGYGNWDQSATEEILQKIRSSSSGVALVTYQGREHDMHVGPHAFNLDTPTHFKEDSVLGRLVAENTIPTDYKCDDGRTSLLQKKTLFAMFKVYSSNIGDEMQAMGALGQFPQVDMFLSRDSLHKGLPTGPDYIFEHLQWKSRRPTVVVIMNSWFGKYWRAPHEDIYPIFQSWHWNVNTAEEIQPQEVFEQNMAYLRTKQPIGARSMHTRDFLIKHNVSSYFTACLTLSIRNRFLAHPYERTDEIFIVDVPRRTFDPNLLKKFFPQWVLESATYLTQDIEARHYPNPNLKMTLAMDYLKAYARAKLVITERVHVALPSLAMGTPVIFLVPNSNYGDSRHTGIMDLMRVVKGDDHADVLKDYDFRSPPPNSAQKDIDRIVERLTSKIHEEFFKAAGTVPVSGSKWW